MGDCSWFATKFIRIRVSTINFTVREEKLCIRNLARFSPESSRPSTLSSLYSSDKERDRQTDRQRKRERERERAGLAICLAICPSTANDRLSRLSLSPLIIDRLIENPRSVSIQQRFGLPSPISSIYTSDLVSERIVRTVRDRVSHKSR